ncbi:MAG: sulfate permease [Myxococcota bacterium]
MPSLPPKKISHWLTILQWLPGYRAADLRGDLAAGVTVGVMLVPQAMAYALLAGVPPNFGLYASLVPLLLYPLLGTSRHLAVGIAAVDMLIVGAAVARLRPQGDAEAVTFALTLTALAGGLQLLMGTLRLGFLVDLLSRPVVAGFIAAAPILIGLSQLGNLLGVAQPRSSELLVLLWEGLAVIRHAHPASALVGGLSVAVLLLIRASKRRAPGALVVVALATAASWLLALDVRGVPTVGPIASGLPAPALPELGHWRELLPGAITLVLVQVMTVMSLGRALARADRYEIRPNRELVALGVANLAGSAFRALPISASFSRTAVNTNAGARTALSNVFAALVVLLGLTAFSGVLALVPMPTLAAIIMVASFGMVSFSETSAIFSIRRADGLIALATLVTTLFVGIEEGVLLGIVVSMMVLITRQARPHIAELGLIPGTDRFRDRAHVPEAVPIPGYLIVRVDSSITFSNAEFIRRDLIRRVTTAPEPLRAIVLDGRGINDIDATAMATLHSLLDDLQSRNLPLLLAHIKATPRAILERGRILPRLPIQTLHLEPLDLIHQFESLPPQDLGLAPQNSPDGA